MQTELKDIKEIPLATDLLSDNSVTREMKVQESTFDSSQSGERETPLYKFDCKELLVPVPLITYCFNHKLKKELRLYLHLKANNSGRLYEFSGYWDGVMTDLGIKDRRTLKKYINKLIGLGWIARTRTGNMMFIRSWAYLKASIGFQYNNTVVRYYPDEGQIDLFNEFCFGAVVGEMSRRSKIIDMYKSSHEKREKRTLAASSQTYSMKKYYGTSLKIISAKLNISVSYASSLKTRSHKKKFILREHKFKKLERSIKPLVGKRRETKERFGVNSGRYSVIKEKRKGKTFFILREQLFDKITPCLYYKTRKNRKRKQNKYVSH